MKHYEALLLDLDNTLYPYEETHNAALDSLYAILQQDLQIEKNDAEHFFKKAREQVQTQLQGTAASHNRLLYFQCLCEQLDLTPARHVLTLYNSYWDTFLNHMTLYPHVKEFLERWVSQGKRICLITDLTAHIQFRKLAKLKLEDYFHKIVTSEEIGHEKPHPSLFLMALDKLKLNKNQVIMIGDHFEKDILGARQLGIAALWFSPEKEKRQDEQGVNFTSLVEMLT